jgi:mRNA interferase RelE/StbE
MTYTVVLPRRMQWDIDRFPEADARRIYAAIYSLRQNPRPIGCIKLTATPYWRLRVGQYRIVYAIDDNELVVTIITVGNRRDVYR